MEQKRMGIFKIPRLMLFDENQAKAVMEGVVVFHTEANFQTDTITYSATHDDFDLIDRATVPTEYEAILNRSDDGKITRTWNAT